MDFSDSPEFARELKRLSKKYPSLHNDLEELKKTLVKLTIRNGGKHWTCLYRDEQICIYKIRLACRYLHSTAMRVIYAHHANESQMVFIELYFKGDKESEDEERIKQYLKEATRG